MATKKLITSAEVWKDLVSELALSIGVNYEVQNTGSATIYLAESLLSPGDSEAYHVIYAGSSLIITPDIGTSFWVRSTCVASSIAATELKRTTTDVSVQDQTTRPIIVKFNQVTNSSNLAVDAAKDTYTIQVDNATGFIVGKYIILFDSISENFSWYNIIGVAGTVLTLDTPLDFSYPAGTNADSTITNMNVDGSVDAQKFGLRGTNPPPGVDIAVDITRIIFKCVTANPIDLIKFGDLAKLTRGLVLRKRDGIIENIFNVKDNGEIEGICFDFTPHAKSKPNEGIDGFTARMTFAGQSKVGVAIRLPLGVDLEFLVQDPLQLLLLLEITAEGHVVEN